MTDPTPDDLVAGSDMGYDEPDDEGGVLFVDLDPPQLPGDVWDRALAVAFDPAAPPHDELVPDTHLEAAYDDVDTTDTDPADDDARHGEDLHEQPDAVSTWDDTNFGPDGTTADYGGDPW